MKNTTIYLMLFTLVLLSCKSNKRAMLIGTWHAVKLENPEMDSFFRNSQAYIDTIGKNHDDATNIQLYGVANMDSMRKILQVQFDSTKAMQMDAIAHTTFKFRKDSIVELSFNGVADSSKWYIDATGMLVLNDLNAQTATDKAQMEILELLGDTLKLKFMENNSSSIVTFNRKGK
jgi:hypothetical protein